MDKNYPYFEIPMIVSFTDPNNLENYLTGIAYYDKIICINDDNVFDIAEIIDIAIKENIDNPIVLSDRFLSDRSNAYNNEIDNYTIDTCYTLDCGWETAIWKGEGEVIIVAYYENEEKAKIGHTLWCTICQSKPTRVWSVQTQQYEIL